MTQPNTPPRPTCGTCPYWAEPRKAGLGHSCRRYAPRPFNADADDWVVTVEGEWCGEHPDFETWLKATRTGGITMGGVTPTAPRRVKLPQKWMRP